MAGPDERRDGTGSRGSRLLGAGALLGVVALVVLAFVATDADVRNPVSYTHMTQPKKA